MWLRSKNAVYWHRFVGKLQYSHVRLIDENGYMIDPRIWHGYITQILVIQLLVLEGIWKEKCGGGDPYVNSSATQRIAHLCAFC